MAGLATGILKNTASTGVPTIAVAGTDYQVPIAANTYDAYGAAAARQANLNLVAGTMTDGYLCSYTSSGTLLSCNTNPSSFITGALVTTLGSPGSDTNIPSEKAVRAAISSAGGGTVSGPSTSTANAIPTWNNTTGTLLQNSPATVDSSGNISIPSGTKYKINGTALAYTDVGADASGAAAAVTTTSIGAIPTSQKAAASGVASLNSSSLVVQNPASATATATASSIPISDSSGTLNSWVTKALYSDVAAGTDNTKAVTAYAIANSVNVPNVAPGTSGHVLTSNGSAWTSAAPAASGLSQQIFTSSGTWTNPNYGTGVARIVWVLAVGAGGGGAGGNANYGGSGGGGGAYMYTAVSVPSSVQTVTVTIGSGGTAGAAGASGGNGGSTSFGSYVSVNGGTGATGSSSGAGSGGSGGVANSLYTLQTVGFVAAGSTGATATSSCSGGASGGGYGAGGNGAAGGNYGGGGSGYGSHSAVAGYAGAAGLCVVYY
jgi:hypothetical protein